MCKTMGIMKEYNIYVEGIRVQNIGIATPRSTLRAKSINHALKEAKKRLLRNDIVDKVTVEEVQK